MLLPTPPRQAKNSWPMVLACSPAYRMYSELSHSSTCSFSTMARKQLPSGAYSSAPQYGAISFFTTPAPSSRSISRPPVAEPITVRSFLPCLISSRTSGIGWLAVTNPPMATASPSRTWATTSAAVLTTSRRGGGPSGSSTGPACSVAAPRLISGAPLSGSGERERRWVE